MNTGIVIAGKTARWFGLFCHEAGALPLPVECFSSFSLRTFITFRQGTACQVSKVPAELRILRLVSVWVLPLAIGWLCVMKSVPPCGSGWATRLPIVDLFISSVALVGLVLSYQSAIGNPHSVRQSHGPVATREVVMI